MIYSNTFWWSFGSFGRCVETWNMISIPLQRVKMEYNPVKSWTVSRPPLYRSNPKNKIIIERWVINGLNMQYLNNQNFLIIISLPFKRTLSPRRVKNSLNWGVFSVFPKICSSVNWFSFTQITPTLSSDLMKTYLQVDGLKFKNITARILISFSRYLKIQWNKVIPDLVWAIPLKYPEADLKSMVGSDLFLSRERQLLLHGYIYQQKLNWLVSTHECYNYQLVLELLKWKKCKNNIIL